MKTLTPAPPWRSPLLFAAAAATLALFALVTPARATIYQWIDTAGNVGFTDDRAKIPTEFRDSATSMSEEELASRVPIRREMPVDLQPIRIPGYLQTRPRATRYFEPPLELGWYTRSERQVYVPNLGFLAEDSPHGPSEHTGRERAVYLNGDRFFLKNPYPVEGDLNWADMETLQRVFGPDVRQPERDIYIGGFP